MIGAHTPICAKSNIKNKIQTPVIIEDEYGMAVEKLELDPVSQRFGGAMPYEILILHPKTVPAELREIIKKDDVCVAIGATSTITEEMPTDKNSLIKRRFLDSSGEIDYGQFTKSPADGYYSLTFERPNGTRYRLRSDNSRFFTERLFNPTPTDRLIEIRKLEDQNAAREAEESIRVAQQETTDLQNYLTISEEGKKNILADLKARKEKGDLIFKNMAVGLPLSYFLANDALCFKLFKSGNTVFDLVMGIEKEVAPGEKPDGLAIRVGEHTIFKIEFAKSPITKKSDGYFIDKTPLKDVIISKIELNKSALDQLFNSPKLGASEFIKGFCNNYKIGMPAFWKPDSEIVGGILPNDSDIQNTYRLRDKRGVNLTFVSFNKKEFYSLTLESSPSDKEISASFD